MSGENSKQVSEIIGSIAAMKTAIYNFPFSHLIDDFFETGNLDVISLLFSLFGLTDDELVEMLFQLIGCKMKKFDGSNDKFKKAADKFLITVEQIVKAALLLNIKNLYTCSANPFIPNYMLRYYYDENGNKQSGTGIVVDLNEIDAFGKLNHCPTDQAQSMLYFDTYTDLKGERYKPTTVWKSTDFDAYLWYVINRGSSIRENVADKCYWDNRNRLVKEFKKEGSTLYDEYFKSDNIGALPDPDPNGKRLRGSKMIEYKADGEANPRKKKYSYLICGYEQHSNYINNNKIRLWLNENRYHKMVTAKNVINKVINTENSNNAITNKLFGNKNRDLLYLNMPIHMFNFEYIYSLKLFDASTFSWNILYKFLGTIPLISPNLSFEAKVLAGEMISWAENIVDTYDDVISDCHFDFDNDRYNEILRKVEETYDGTYRYNSATASANEEFTKAYVNYLNSGQEVPSITEITKTLHTVSDIKGLDNQYGDVNYNIGLSIAGLEVLNVNNFIRLLKTIARELVLSLLQPKVVMLYIVNIKMMGDPLKRDDTISIKEVLVNLKNVLKTVISEVLKTLLTELFEILMEELKKLISLYIYKLALERVQDLIKLYETFKDCLVGPFWFRGRKTNLNVADVNYADIISSGDNYELEKTC